MSSVPLETKMKPCSLTYWLQKWRVVGRDEAWLAHFECDRQNLIPFKAFILKGLPLSEHFHHEMIWNKSHRFVKHSIRCIGWLSVRISCPLASGSIHFFFNFCDSFNFVKVQFLIILTFFFYASLVLTTFSAVSHPTLPFSFLLILPLLLVT